MANNKEMIMVEQYRKVRGMQRQCIVQKLTDKPRKEEEALVTKWNKIINPLREQLEKNQHICDEAHILYMESTKEVNSTISQLNNEIYKQESKRNKEIITLKSKNKILNLNDPCIEKRPSELAKHDRETEEKILKFLNGDLDKLEA